VEKAVKVGLIILLVLLCLVLVVYAIVIGPSIVGFFHELVWESEAEEAATWTGEFDWSQVEIRDVQEYSSYYRVTYYYPYYRSSRGHGYVDIDNDKYSPAAVRAAITEEVTKYLAEDVEKERLRQELEEGLS